MSSLTSQLYFHHLIWCVTLVPESNDVLFLLSDRGAKLAVYNNAQIIRFIMKSDWTQRCLPGNVSLISNTWCGYDDNFQHANEGHHICKIFLYWFLNFSIVMILCNICPALEQCYVNISYNAQQMGGGWGAGPMKPWTAAQMPKGGGVYEVRSSWCKSIIIWWRDLNRNKSFD